MTLLPNQHLLIAWSCNNIAVVTTYRPKFGIWFVMHLNPTAVIGTPWGDTIVAVETTSKLVVILIIAVEKSSSIQNVSLFS